MRYPISKISDIIKANSQICCDDLISCLLTDSRTLTFPENTLFFAIRTRTNDGHKYIDDLLCRGVRNFVINNDYPFSRRHNDANWLAVEDTIAALQTLAAYHRRQFAIPVIGITGSNGKTVVKELLYQILRNDFNIVRSPRSYNSQTGVPLSVWEMNEYHSLGVFEAGISQPGEMQKLQCIIAPTVGLITNIGEAHQENFNSKIEKAMEKTSLFSDCETIIYNSDNKLITTALSESGLLQKSKGWSRNNPDAMLFINSVNKEDSTTKILFTTDLGIRHQIEIPFTDDAFIEDVIHCLALINHLSPNMLYSKDDVFASLESVAMRLEVKQGVNGCMLINDTYNSDINSLLVALDFQQTRRAGKDLKSTVILSDILQSGISDQELYSRVSEIFRSKNIDRIIGIGSIISRHEDLFKDIEHSFYPDTETFIKSLNAEMFHNEMILLKGSRMFHFEDITELLAKKVHETILEVNLDAIIHNFNYYRSRLNPKTKMICMVKAFGYGVGSFEVAKTLQEHRCDYLAVAVADEGEDLRREGISIPILVMNPEMSSFTLLFEYNLEPEIYSFRMLDALIKEAERRGITSFPVHIKIDTGMHRLGFEPADIPEICRKIKSQSGLAIRSVFSHLVGSDSPDFDDYTYKQINAFTEAATELENTLGYPVLKHILNSAGIERFVDYQLDMVRMGIALYGVSASGVPNGLQCVCSLKTVILQIRNVAAGESVGYSRKTFVSRDSRIATIPIGYADGLNRHLSNGAGEVLIAGKRCPIVGNICMDACMIDVTDIEANEGDAVIIFNEELTVSELAQKTATIPYEILTSISPRVKRVYYRE